MVADTSHHNIAVSWSICNFCRFGNCPIHLYIILTMNAIGEGIQAFGKGVSKVMVSILLTTVYVLLVPYKYLMPKQKKDVHIHKEYSIEDFKYMY